MKDILMGIAAFAAFIVFIAVVTGGFRVLEVIGVVAFVYVLAFIITYWYVALPLIAVGGYLLWKENQE